MWAGAASGGTSPAFNTLPDGWVLCNGASLSTTGTYAALYTAIGTRYGSGAGTFNLPNFTTRLALGLAAGSTPTIPKTTTTSSQSVNHSHTITSSAGNQSASHGHAITSNAGNQSAAHTHAYSANTGNVSADHTHNVYGGNSAKTTSGISANHFHSVSGNTGSESANHSHTITSNAGNESANHSHTITSNAGDNSVNHSHNVDVVEVYYIIRYL